VAVNGSHLLVANEGGPDNEAASVVELNVSDGKLVRVMHAQSVGLLVPTSLAIGHRHVWIGNASKFVTELNASNGALIRVIKIGSAGNQIADIALAGSHLWVVAYSFVAEINVANGEVVRIMR
jgi:hypothetical protein